MDDLKGAQLASDGSTVVLANTREIACWSGTGPPRRVRPTANPLGWIFLTMNRTAIASWP